MFAHVLIAADLESAARVVPASVADLEALGASRVTLVYVPGVANTGARTDGGSRALAGAIDEHAGPMRAAGMEVDLEILPGYAAAEIVAAAERARVGLIILGARTHSTRGRILLGATASEILRRAPVPVLLNPPPDGGSARRLLGHVILATDGSPAAGSAEASVTRLAKRAGRTSLLAVASVADNLDAGELGRHLQALKARCCADTAEATVIENGRASDAIAAAADERGATLVVVGRRGHGAGNQKLLGSTAENVTRKLGVPVLMVPPGY